MWNVSLLVFLQKKTCCGFVLLLFLIKHESYRLSRTLNTSQFVFSECSFISSSITFTAQVYSQVPLCSYFLRAGVCSLLSSQCFCCLIKTQHTHEYPLDVNAWWILVLCFVVNLIRSLDGKHFLQPPWVFRLVYICMLEYMYQRAAIYVHTWFPGILCDLIQVSPCVWSLH